LFDERKRKERLATQHVHNIIGKVVKDKKHIYPVPPIGPVFGGKQATSKATATATATTGNRYCHLFSPPFLSYSA